MDQVRLESGADILHLDQLDQKLWVALSCPVKGLEFDERTLALLDTDGDGFVRPLELIAAVKWLRQVLKSGDDLAAGEDGFRLANLRTDTDEGKALLASARHILKSIGKADAAALSVDDAMATADFFAQARLNGDGVVPVDEVADEDARAVAADIVACLGGVTDRSGRAGYDRQKLDAFFADCAAFDAWWKTGEADADTVLPLGAGTAAASAAVDVMRAKIDDWFGRCRLAAFDQRAIAALNREESAYLEAAAKDLSLDASELAHLPLAMVEPGKALPLADGVNPAWAAGLAALRQACLGGKAALTEAEWSELRTRFDAHKAWAAGKSGAAVEKLGIERVRAILAGATRDLLQAAIDEDLSVAAEVGAMNQVELLARLHRDFADLLNNFVSFTDFYARRGAIFQAGTLHLDGRALDLCFHVNDAGKHGQLAAMSKSYLAYCDCTRGGKKITVACAFTAGDSDNLFVGRNGIFYDRQGNDWNATITKIIDNPISVRQAFWSPYKKVLRWIEESVAKRAAAADQEATAKLQSGAAATGDAAKGAAPPKPKFDVGVVAALGVAVGGITAALSAFLAAFFGLGAWMPIGVVALLLAISGPSMLIAWLKLRQRNLGPILDANGWAVNALTKINIPLGTSLTALPRLPDGSKRSLVDPYAPERSIWPRLLLVLLVLAGVGYGLYRFNVLHRWFPDHVPEYRSATFDGADSAPEGTASIVVELGSGATHVTRSVAGAEPTRLAVTGDKVTVDLTGLTAGQKVVLTDPTTGASHTIEITAKN
ncbi:MAG: hypothetical protein AB7O84_16455 [Planctomycetota bacterium]